MRIDTKTKVVRNDPRTQMPNPKSPKRSEFNPSFQRTCSFLKSSVAPINSVVHITNSNFLLIDNITLDVKLVSLLHILFLLCNVHLSITDWLVLDYKTMGVELVSLSVASFVSVVHITITYCLVLDTMGWRSGASFCCTYRFCCSPSLYTPVSYTHLTLPTKA